MSNIAILSSSLIYRPTSSPSTTQIPGVSVELELTATPNNTTKKSTIKWNLYLRNTGTSEFTNSTGTPSITASNTYRVQFTYMNENTTDPDSPNYENYDSGNITYYANFAANPNSRILLKSGETVNTIFTDKYVAVISDVSFSFKTNYSVASNNVATASDSRSSVYFDSIVPDVAVLNFTNFTNIDGPTVSYSLSYTSGVTLTAKVSIGNWQITRTIDNPKTNGTYSFTMDVAENVALCNETWNTNTAIAMVTLTATTAYGSSTAIGSSILTIQEASPQLAPTYQIIYTGSGGSSLIYGDNKITVNCNATFQKGAREGTFSIACGNKVINASSGTFTNVESNIITCTVTDSRGNSTTKSITVAEFIDYIPLTCVVESTNPIENEDESVTASFNISGAIFTGLINGTANTIVLQYRITSNGVADTWVTKPNSEITITNNKYSTVVTTSFPKTDKVLIDVKAQDSIKEVTTTSDTVTLTPVFDWSGTDFNFNVPIYLNGKLIPLISESGTFTSGSNTFYYRKWNDGTSECWGNISGSVDISSSANFGNLYSSEEISASNITFPEGLFIDKPDVIAQLESRGTVGFLVASTTSASATQSGSYQIVQPSNSSSPNYTICYQVKGRWKI